MKARPNQSEAATPFRAAPLVRALPVLLLAGACAAPADPPAAGVLSLRPDRTVHQTCRKNLIGSNIALWNQTWELFDDECRGYVRELGPAYIRMPGGSWANHYYWNGNGVRDGDRFDRSKLKDGVWQVDYSDYKPGFSIQGEQRLPVADGFHGNVDVKKLHELIGQFGAEPVVTVNLGTGTPEMAAEWVRWANKKNNFHVRYWELGNELEGSWELGHILPDGSKMTGEVFARRFREFSAAMKAVDPSIKTGGPASSNYRGAFIEELLRDAGDAVDFISFHTYPVENRAQSEKEFFGEIANLEPAVAKIRGWIAAYQPERTGAIELAVTEWNSKVVEDRDTADLLNGLWSCIWVGEMFRNGITFANQWDLLTATETGGHGLFYFERFDFDQPGVPQAEMDRRFNAFNPPCIPKSQYWAFYLWSRFMGDRLIESSLSGAPDVYAAATRSDDALQVMLVNRSHEQAAAVRLEAGEPLADAGTAVTLSHREYFWDPFAHEPKWSRRPQPVAVPAGPGTVYSIPPFSAIVLDLPLAGKAAVPVPTNRPAEKTAIELLLPAETAEDVPVEAWVLTEKPAPYDPSGRELTAELSVEGPARLDRTAVRMSEGAGRFSVVPTGTGVITLSARFGGQTASAQLTAQPVQARPEILWAFEGDMTPDLRSDFALRLSDEVKPNQQTAAVRIAGEQPTGGKDVLLQFQPLPEKLAKERVGGFTFEVRTSHNFACDDPGAFIQVVLQSSSDHWIPIGQIPLAGLKERWKTADLRIASPSHLAEMKWLYGVRLQLVSTRPISGEVYIDNAGVILR